jgi:hypothetical protein
MVLHATIPIFQRNCYPDFQDRTLFSYPEGGVRFLQKCWQLHAAIHDTVSQRTMPFIFIASRTQVSHFFYWPTVPYIFFIHALMLHFIPFHHHKTSSAIWPLCNESPYDESNLFLILCSASSYATCRKTELWKQLILHTKNSLRYCLGLLALCVEDVPVKNAVFLDVAPCRSCANRRFRGTYRLHLLIWFTVIHLRWMRVHSSKTSANFHWSTWHHTSEVSVRLFCHLYESASLTIYPIIKYIQENANTRIINWQVLN